MQVDLVQETELTLAKLDALYLRTKHLRYGQLYMNAAGYKQPWPALYYEKDGFKAREMIRAHMTDLQNYDYVNRQLDAYEKCLQQNLSGRSSSPQSITTVNRSGQGTTGSGTNVFGKSPEASQYSRLLRANGFHPRASCSARG